jgi:phage terminase large subunit-like protein
LNLPRSRSDYQPLFEMMKDLHPDDVMGLRRYLAKNDLYYLLRYELSTKYAKDYAEGKPLLDHDFLFERCREVQAEPNGFLDLWARYHFKTTIITFGLSMQTMICNPESTICILSQNNKEATKKLVQIKNELQTNHDFIELFNDIFMHDFRKYELWSEEKGITINRKGNPREPSFSAYGLVDSQPTGAHFTHLVYDDVVVPQSVVSDISIRNTTEAWEVSLNLSLYGGVKRYVGTRYHFNDTYQTIIEREVATVRRYPCYRLDDSGNLTGIPALYPDWYLQNERRGMGPYTWACQMLLDPVAESQQGFKAEWAKHYVRPPQEERPGRITYLIGDPAGVESKDADDSAFVVLGVGADRKIRLLDAVYDKINMTRRWQKYKELHMKWRPLYSVYERLGKDTEVEYMRERMMLEGYVFNIIEVGGTQNKESRINRLVAPFENGDILLPQRLPYKREFDGREIDIVNTLVNVEMRGYPMTKSDHLLDAIARLYDEKVPLHFPKGDYDPMTGDLIRRKKDHYLPLDDYDYGSTWCSI